MVVEKKEVHACDRCKKVGEVVTLPSGEELCEKCSEEYERVISEFWRCENEGRE